MGNRKKPLRPRDSGRRNRTTRSAKDKHVSGRSHSKSAPGAVSNDDATLRELHRGRASSRDTEHSSRDTRDAPPLPARSHRKDGMWRAERDDDAPVARDGHSGSSRSAHEGRESGRDDSYGTGATGPGTNGRGKSHSAYCDGAGPANWDDVTWRGEIRAAEEEDRGRPTGAERHTSHSRARNHYGEYGAAAASQRSRSARAHAENAGNTPLHKRGNHSSRVGQWSKLPGALFAVRNNTVGGRPSAMKRLLGTRRRIVLVSIAAIIVFCAFISVPVTIVSANQSLSMAHDGLNHLKSAENSLKLVGKNPFDTASITSARAEFAAAHDDFFQVSLRLGLISGVANVVPGAGSKVSAASHLIPIALEGTQAAIIACDALNLVVSSLKDPLNPKASGLSRDNYDVVQAEWAQIQQLVGTLVDQINALQPSDLTLDPRLGPAIQSFRANLPKIQNYLQSMGVLVQLLPQLIGIGQPSNYLVEVLDSTELRPAGGFIGNYGFLTMSGGRLTGVHIQDVDLLDVKVKYGNHVIPVPKQYSWLDPIFGAYMPTWGFRDSNLDADFPTSARNGEKLYRLEAGDLVSETQYFTRKPVPVVGVIAITPWLIQNALRITGPIYIGDMYKETVTADNLIDRIHYYALQNTFGGGCDTCPNAESGTSNRKRFTGFLFQAFMEKIKTSLSGNIGKFAKLFTDSLHAKDIQVYLNDPTAENMLRQYGVASAIEAPAAGDSVFEVDANISGNKSNYVLKYSMSDSITIDASGTATHHLTFSYTWPKNPKTLQQTFPAEGVAGDRYHAYSRVYLPPWAVIQSSNGWGANTPKAFGRTVYGGNVYGFYGTTQTYTLTWKVPRAATHDAMGWHYHLLFQKQAGITWPLNLKITLPTCATVMEHSDLLNASGAKALMFKDPLLNDLNLSIDYSC